MLEDGAKFNSQGHIRCIKFILLVYAVPSTLEVLPEIVAAVRGRAEVFIDGGIRRGTDVLKALALGANAVMLGR